MRRLSLLAILALGTPLIAQTLEDYNVVWTSPSQNASESMPCGGGDIGLNVWVEQGDLLIYLSRSGTFDEANGMPKLGRLRVTLAPNPFAEGGTFRQELKLRQGHVTLEGEKDGCEAAVDVWVDVFRPVVHVEVASSKPTSVTGTYEGWRLQDREQKPLEGHANRSWLGAPRKAMVYADEVGFRDDAVRFVHRNRSSECFDLVVAQQGLNGVKDQLWDPQKGLTFGGELSGSNMVPAGTTEGVYASTPFRGWKLQSRAPARKHALTAVLHVANTETIGAWDAGVRAIRDDAAAHRKEARATTQAWWRAFWERSHVFIDAGRADPTSPSWQIGRNYQVFRYQLGCNARSAWPTKFNGGLFTFDPEYIDPASTYTPDFRRWGGGSFTAQNQRLVYWPMLRNGDFDLMRPQFEYYQRILGNAELRSQVYWGITGASFVEQIENFGLPVAFEYRWKRKPDVDPGIQDNAWVNYQWDTVFEFCQMILDLRRYTDADIREYLPLIESCLSFYDEYYQRETQKRTGSPLSPDAKLVIFPGTALETYKDALNPAPTICALHRVLEGVLELPPDWLADGHRARWETMLGRLPELHFREMNGHRVISPAWEWSRIQNAELPQLYPVYPWGFYGVGRPDLQVAIDTWHHGVDDPKQKAIQSWHQDAIFCARLGLTDEAADLTTQKMRDSGRRFPTWWGPGNDWVPDHNWGGSGMIGVQEMLLQEVDGKLHLLPSWPMAWDVDFRLHASGGTVIGLRLEAGKLRTLKITPASRAADVVLPAGMAMPAH